MLPSGQQSWAKTLLLCIWQLQHLHEAIDSLLQPVALRVSLQIIADCTDMDVPGSNPYNCVDLFLCVDLLAYRVLKTDRNIALCANRHKDSFGCTVLLCPLQDLQHSQAVVAASVCLLCLLLHPAITELFSE